MPRVSSCRSYSTPWREENCSAGGGGGVTRKPIFSSPPPPPWLPLREGGFSPTSMAQNDTHVALIILTTQMWGGGGNYWWKKLFRAKICVPAPSAPTSVLTQNKGHDTEPHFSTPPPPSAGVHVTPPPPPQSNFQVALAWHDTIRILSAKQVSKGDESRPELLKHV